MSLHKSFPEGYTPTETQQHILKELDEFQKSDEKFCILQAPTGSGKTFIAKTLLAATKESSQRWRDINENYDIYKLDAVGESFGGYVLTTTKQLQDQYIDTFESLELLKGKANYDCDIDSSCCVDNAPCAGHPGVRKQCWQVNQCTYYNQRKDMLMSKEAVLNYSVYFKMQPKFKERDLLICDEASELEDTIVSAFSLEVDIVKLRKVGIKMEKLDDPNSVKAVNWLKSLALQCNAQIESIKDSDVRTALGKAKLKKLTELSHAIGNVVENYIAANYIIDVKGTEVKFVPLYCHTLAHKMFDLHEKVVLMSATIVDPEMFARTLGIKSYKLIDVPSEFDPKKSPIAFSGSIQLNKKNLDKNIGKVIDTVRAVLKTHKDSKGIIHTSTHDIAKRVSLALRDSRIIVRKPGDTNEDLLEMHRESPEPTVLVSPSMMFGVDLIGDLAEFQVIVKSPYVSLGDKRVSTLMKKNPRWYETKMLVKLVQSCGRGIRNTDDECVTYILDATAKNAVLRNKRYLPQYFLDRIV